MIANPDSNPAAAVTLYTLSELGQMSAKQKKMRVWSVRRTNTRRWIDRKGKEKPALPARTAS
jgi:hypothetical protein